MFPLLLVTILLCPLSPEAQEYYVTPTPPPNPDCPLDQPCHTLSYYASNASSLFNNRDNVSLLFLDGPHNFNVSLEIVRVHYLTIAGATEILDLEYPQTVIKYLELHLETVLVFNIEKVTLEHSIISIFNVEVFNNQRTTYKHSTFSFNSVNAAQILIGQSKFMSTETIFSLQFAANVTNTNISNLTAARTFTIIETMFSGDEPTNFSFVQHVPAPTTSTATVKFIDLLFSGPQVEVFINQPFYSLNMDVINCAVANSSRTGLEIVKNGDADMYIRIMNSTFVGNRLGLSVIGNTAATILNVTIENAQFLQNEKSGLFELGSGQSLLLHNTSFVDNVETLSNGLARRDDLGDLRIRGPMIVTVDSCLFNGYVGVSSVLATDAQLYFLGNTTFSNNVGISGGALAMINTTMWLDYGTHIRFINNRASEVGGAIQIEENHQITGESTCFYRLNFDLQELLENVSIPVSITFENNKARLGGDDIYGAGLQSSCKMTPNRQIGSYQVQQKIFEFHTPTNTSVSSSPTRVCVCDQGLAACDTRDYVRQISATPGEKFSLSIAIVGNDFGLVTGSVYGLDIDGEDYTFSFSPGEKLQQIAEPKCTDIEYSVQLVNKETKNVQFILSIDSTTAALQRVYHRSLFTTNEYEEALDNYAYTQEISGLLLVAPILVNISILPCPLGMRLSNGTHKTCQCDPKLANFVERCVVENNTALLYRNGSTWIGISPHNNSTIWAQNYCPSEYCKTETLGVNLDNPDSQCALNRTGVLCGGCPPGLSLAGGTSKCIHCPNNNGLAFLVVFALSGLTYVLMVRLLDFTVAHGTVNGLIFFANAVWINQDLFFPRLPEDTDQNLTKFYYFVQLFVGFLNYDGAVETCFIQGLDEYTITWLKFFFPLYIWIISILIVLVCHYSPKATKLFGNNSVPILATAIYLSYSELLINLSAGLGLAVVNQYQPEGTQWVWLLDGNVQYFRNPHAFLGITAIFALFILWAFTLTLLFAGHLHKLPWISHKVYRIRPFLDAFTGPLKPKHRYWIGLTLLVRNIFAVNAVIVHGFSPTASIAVVVLLSTVLCILADVYKNKYLYLLELSFLFNVVSLGVAYLCTEDIETRVICTCVSVTVCLLIFIGILTYHSYLAMKKLRKHILMCTCATKSEEKVEEIEEAPAKPRVPSQTFIELRETLMETEI